MKNNATENRIKFVLYAIILGTFLLYVGQSFIYKLRFNAIGAEKELVTSVAEECSTKTCEATFKLTPKKKYLLLGHIMRQHQFFDQSGKQIYPISKLRGVAIDSWRNLRIYPVIPGETYTLVAKKPKAVKLDYFMGILPRSSNHEGMLSIPDISPSLNSITTLISFIGMWLLLGAAYLVPRSSSAHKAENNQLVAYSISAIAITIVSLLVTGVADSLIPDGELRSFLIRTSAVISVTAPFLFNFIKKMIFNVILSSIITASIPVVIFSVGWDNLRSGIGYISIHTACIIVLSLLLVTKKKIFPSLLVLMSIWDTFFMMGLAPLEDIPPMYLLQPVLVAAFSLIFSDLGAMSIIALAAKAYQRFSRDLIINGITAVLAECNQIESDQLSESVKKSLASISKLTGAARVSILLNFPFSRPIFHRFHNDKVTTFDDGKIPGAVTIRSFLYGDEAWFESYESFIERSSQHHDSEKKEIKNTLGHHYVCISPIRVNGTNMGVFMLTGFDDERIEKLFKNGSIEDEKETIKSVIQTLEASFSEIVISNLKDSSETANKLVVSVRDAISTASNEQDFLNKYCRAIYNATGLMTIIHKKQGDKGVALAQCGMPIKEASSFFNNPFNLASSAKVAYGSTVVAFRENKTSFVKDWIEISDKLHEKTRALLDGLGAMSLMATPLKQGNESYVVTLLSSRSQGAKDPGVLKVIESTEAIFDAAITVLSQKSSVHALGNLATRLIGDDEIRDKVVEAAKSDSLPSIVGSKRKSFLFLIDLVGSSNFKGDAEQKATAYGKFYDKMDEYAEKLTQGKVRKTIGDAIIITWDGSSVTLLEQYNALAKLQHLVILADKVAKDVGCEGVRSVLHYGDYFFGLVGTSTFGQIDVVGSGIDYVCKLEGYVKELKLFTDNRILVCVSNEAASILENNSVEFVKSSTFIATHEDDLPISLSSEVKKKIAFLCTEIGIKKAENEAVIEVLRAS